MVKNRDREKKPLEECQWCDTTGDVEKNRGIYWTAVFVIIAIIVLIYILSAIV
jgi:hypothetical protein